jgi:hypothetical protein
VATMRHLERIQGRGQLECGGRRLSVSYCLDIFQEMIDAGDGEKKPGLKNIKGMLGTRDREKFAKLMIGGHSPVLHLADGRKLRVLFVDSCGLIKGTGGFFT